MASFPSNGGEGCVRRAFSTPSGRISVLFGLVVASFLIFLWIWEEPWGSKSARRLAEGKTLRVQDWVNLGLWFGAALNAMLFALLAATARIWMRLAGDVPPAEKAPPSPPRWFWVAMALAVAVAACLRVPLLSQSMLRDESDTLVRNVHGVIRIGPDGAEKFQQATWRETLWEDGGANNPIFYSILAKTSLQAAHRLFGLPHAHFSPIALRLPSLLAGIACCVAVGWLGYLMAGPLAGALAANILAVHPWHIRYSVEGRGYSLAMLFGVLAAAALLRALQRGTWREWSFYALFQFLLLYSYPGALYLAAAFGLVAFLVCLSQKSRRIAQATRLTIVNLVSAGSFLFLMSPCIPQMLHYLKKSTALGTMGWCWLEEFIGISTAGIALGVYDGAPPAAFGRVHNLAHLADEPVLQSFVAIVIPLLFVIGFVLLLRRGTPTAAIAIAAVVAPALSLLHNTQTGNYLYPWYLIYCLPFLVLFKAVALQGLGSRCGPRFAAVVPGVYLLFFVVISHEGLEPLHRKTAAPFVKFERGTKTDRVYPDGRITRTIAAER